MCFRFPFVYEGKLKQFFQNIAHFIVGHILRLTRAYNVVPVSVSKSSQAEMIIQFKSGAMVKLDWFIAKEKWRVQFQKKIFHLK